MSAIEPFRPGGDAADGGSSSGGGSRPPVSPQMALRVAIIGGIALVMFGVIFFRLWYLQVLTGEQYVQEASANAVRELPISAPRHPKDAAICSKYNRKSFGSGARTSTHAPLEGCANPMRAACRKLRSRIGRFRKPAFNPRGAPYRVSPTTGCPIAAKCARI